MTLRLTSFASSRYSVNVAFTTFSSLNSSLSSSPWFQDKGWFNKVRFAPENVAILPEYHTPRRASCYRSCCACCSSTPQSPLQSSPCSRSSCPASSCPGTSPSSCPGPSTSRWCPAGRRSSWRWPRSWGWGSSPPRAARWRCRTLTWAQSPSCNAPGKPDPLSLATVGHPDPERSFSSLVQLQMRFLPERGEAEEVEASLQFWFSC